MIHIYGIKNCDTMKKALKWLDAHSVELTFHDYKKEGASEAVIKQAIQQHGWENVINRRGTTWRKLPDDVKAQMNGSEALDLALEQTSLIKRPLLCVGDDCYLGFDEATYQALFV